MLPQASKNNRARSVEPHHAKMFPLRESRPDYGINPSQQEAMKMSPWGFIIVLAFGFILTSMEQAWAKVEGIFMIVKGEVKVISPDQKSEFARVGMKVTEGYSIVTGVDGRAKIVMSDKNILNINPETQLKIETYKNEGGNKKVELSLPEGSVRAMVNQKYDDNKNTFRVKTPTAVAGVRGTDFLVKFDMKTQLSSVKTFEGLVAVGNPADVLKGGSRAAALALVAAGQQVELDGRSNQKPEPKPIPQKELKELDRETDVEKSEENSGAQNQDKNPEKSRSEQAKNENVEQEQKREQNEVKKEAGESRQEQAQERREQAQERREQAQERKEVRSQEQGNASNPQQGTRESQNNSAPSPRAEAAPARSDLVKVDDLKVDNIKSGVQESLPANRVPAQIAPQLPNPVSQPAQITNNPVTNNLIGETIRNQVGTSTRRLQIGIIKNENPVPTPGTGPKP